VMSGALDSEDERCEVCYVQSGEEEEDEGSGEERIRNRDRDREMSGLGLNRVEHGEDLEDGDGYNSRIEA